ncbi:hypothetical protein FRC05_007413 [Tulasnella sp. 425]|nr:hypothetical protein FRC05_007413 [Tulasnella sp. 425]
MQTSISNASPNDNTQADTAEKVKDVYSLYGRYIIEEHMLDKLDNDNPIEIPMPETETASFNSGYIGNKTVGILGGGVGGLYAAMMLDSVNVPYEVLEARDRVGGRLFTHKFENGNFYDYFDVGAMRYPKNATMKRTFELFESTQLNSDGIDIKGKMIKYEFKSPNAFACYNGQPPVRVKNLKLKTSDFEFEEMGISPEDLAKGADTILWEKLLVDFVPLLLEDLKTNGDAGWKKLMEHDKHTSRSYLGLVKGLDTQTINWLETVSFGTGWFDQGLAEMVLESIAFGTYKDAPKQDFWCLKGGSHVLPDAMKTYIDKKNSEAIQLNKRVVGIKAAANNDRINRESGIYVRVAGEEKSRQYHHVISTLPLPVLRSLDIEQAQLDIHQYNALRQLQYGPSEKIGVIFKSQWWRTAKTINGEKLNIVGGQSYSDRCVRTVVYPSYGTSLNPDTEPESRVLIASYSWTHDALRLGALISAGDKCKEQVKDLVLRDLAAIHNMRYEFLQEQYVDHFGWDWQHDEYTQGAFAFFGPGEFSSLYKSLTRPAANGHIHFAGEALSVRHAWVVGALDSAWRAVKEVLWVSHPEALPEFERKWGNNEEWIVSKWLKSQKGDSIPDAQETVHVKADLVLCQVMAHVGHEQQQ